MAESITTSTDPGTEAPTRRRADARIVGVTLRRLVLPLHQPYRLSYRTFEEFQPIVAEIVTADGRTGWGEGHISPGSSKETREGGWAFACRHARALPGLGLAQAFAAIRAVERQSPVAACALATAIEMAGNHPLLCPREELRLPLLVPVNAADPAGIAREVERKLEAGWRTFKVKVGGSVAEDLARVRSIQRAAAGRATLRLDANRGFSRDEAIAFVRGLDPDGIELFEQPCPTEAWEDNAAVAAASPVPVMLDEPICTLADIARAATLANVRFCKIKLKRFGSLDALRAALEAIRAGGMGAVLGDGLSGEIGGWMEACAGAGLVHGAGEFNGFLKTRDRLLVPPLAVEGGVLRLPAGYAPEIDRDVIAARTVESVHHDA